MEPPPSGRLLFVRANEDIKGPKRAAVRVVEAVARRYLWGSLQA